LARPRHNNPNFFQRKWYEYQDQRAKNAATAASNAAPVPVAGSTGATPVAASSVVKEERSKKGLIIILLFAVGLVIAIATAFASCNPNSVNPDANDSSSSATASTTPSGSPTATPAPTAPAVPPADNPVGNGDGSSLPSDPIRETNKQLYRQYAQQNGQIEGVDYSFEIDRDWADTVYPGEGVFGQSAYNERELVSAYGNGSTGSEEAIRIIQQETSARIGQPITREMVLDPNNWLCRQQLKAHKSEKMYGFVHGKAVFGPGFADRAGGIICAFMPEPVKKALAAGKQFTLFSADGGCINPQEDAVTTNEVPYYPPVKPIKKSVPPTGQTVVQTPPPAEKPVPPTCNTGCNPPPCVQTPPPGEGWTWDQENCRWCPPVVTPPTDACPEIPGNQPPGTDCNPVTPPTDACPEIPGNQPPGTDCNPVTPPTDACPEIPGNQPPGTDCNPVTPPTDACPEIPGNQPPGTDCDAKDPEDDVIKDDGLPQAPPPTTVTPPAPENPAGPPSDEGNGAGDEVVGLPADGAEGDVVPDRGTPPAVPVDVPSNDDGTPLEGDVDPDAAIAAPAAAPAAAPVAAVPASVAPAPVAAAPVVAPAPAPVVEAPVAAPVVAPVPATAPVSKEKPVTMVAAAPAANTTG
jgi:hypothetical protein